MFKKLKYTFLLLGIAFLFSSWGFYAHRKINRMAVFTLPPEMIGFYKKNIEYLTEHAVDPDKRRYAVEGEAVKHYIDIDHYAENGENPFDLMPKKWNDAVEKYSEDTLKEYGIVPWQIAFMTYWLTDAFMEKDADKIIRLSTDLGHYIADASVPLHTTKNYNGQLTGQKGIHALWESRIPELVANDFDFMVGRAEYIKSPLNAAWQLVEESFSHVDSVLWIEMELSRTFPIDQKYTFETRGQSTVKQYSQAYAMAYHKRMGDMVEKRMQRAVFMIGSIWYTAWVNAGQPNLDGIYIKVDRDERKKDNKEVLPEEKLKVRPHEP